MKGGSMRVLRWEKPPPPNSDHDRGNRSSQWDEAAAQLRENAGVWGVIYEGPAARVAAVVNAIRVGGMRCFRPPGVFEAARRNLDGTSRVLIYARYVGDESEADS